VSGGTNKDGETIYLSNNFILGTHLRRGSDILSHALVGPKLPLSNLQ